MLVGLRVIIAAMPFGVGRHLWRSGLGGLVNHIAQRAARFGVLAAAIVLGACGGQDDKNSIGGARALLEKRQYATAIVQLKDLLQRDAGSGEARWLLGRALLESGDPRTAEIELRKAREAKQPDAVVLPLLAEAMLAQGKERALIEEFGSVSLSEARASAELSTALARAFLRQGNQARADAALASALKTVPDFPPALLVQARIAVSAGDLAGAKNLAERVIAAEPDSHEAWKFKGDLALQANRDTTAALAAYAQALKSRPEWSPAHAAIIELLISLGKADEAKTRVDDFRKLHPQNPQAHYYVAQLAFLRNDLKAAREELQQLLRATPKNVRVLQLAGAVELQGGNVSQAEAHLGRAVQLAPDYRPARLTLGRLYLQAGNAGKALETLKPLLDRPDAAGDSDLLALAAEARLVNGEPDRAEALYVKAVAAKPGDSKIRVAAALTQLVKGRADAGFSELAAVAAADPSPAADLAMVAARMRRGEWDAALAALDGLDRKMPGKPFAAELRGRVLLQKGDVAAAKDSFLRALKASPDYFPAAAQLARLDLSEGRVDLARGRYEAVLRANPSHLHAELAAVDLNAREGGAPEAVSQRLTEIVKGHPADAAPRIALVNHHLAGRRFKEAVTAAQEAAAAMPANADVLEALARALALSGDSRQSAVTLGKLAAQYANAPELHVRIAAVHMIRRDTAATLQSLDRALAIQPDLLSAQEALIKAQLALKKFPEALKTARLVQRQRPKEAAGYVLEGDIEAVRKDFNAAAKAYGQGLELAGGGSAVAMKRHSVLMAAGRQKEAGAVAQSWLGGHPKDAEFRVYLGDLALSRNDFAESERRYAEAVKQLPDNAVLLNNLAWIYFRLNKPAMGLGFAERASALQPQDVRVLDTLAQLLASDGQLAKAIEVQKKVVTLAPTSHDLRLQLANMYLLSGDHAQAKTELLILEKLGDKYPKAAMVRSMMSKL